MHVIVRMRLEHDNEPDELADISVQANLNYEPMDLKALNKRLHDQIALWTLSPGDRINIDVVKPKDID